MVTFTSFELPYILEEAKVLIGEGENLEYTRGVLEILTSFMYIERDMCHADKVIYIARQIGLDEGVISRLY